MKIANLEHVQAISTSEITGGFGGGYNTKRSKEWEVRMKETVDIKKRLHTVSYVHGNSAIAEGDAEAYGLNSNAEAFSYTVTTPISSAASATSISQS